MASGQHVITAHPQRWEVLGALLRARRVNLGYATRAAFERERQIPAWLIAVFENAKRRSIEPGKLRTLAQAYGFTYESALAVLRGEADELALVPPGPPDPLPAPAPSPERRAPRRKSYAAGAAVPASLPPIEGAPADGRRLLGVLLAQRRTELGYTHLPPFARDRMPLTRDGNPNTRLLADLERARRDTFPEPKLRYLAQVYGVTYESMTDVAHLRARALSPVSPGAAADPGPNGDAPPMPAAAAASDRPWFDAINERRVALAARGVLEPSGTQMFPDAPDDAKAWDGIGSRWSVSDRVWLIADLRRRAAERHDGGSGSVAGA